MRRFCATRARRLRTGILIAAGVLGLVWTSSTTTAQEPAPKVSGDKARKLAAGEADAKRMLLLMDKDKNGKVSKEEFMSFMEAEFQRLDVNKDGELDVKELTQSSLQLRSHGK